MKYLTIKVGSNNYSGLNTFNYPESGLMPSDVWVWANEVLLKQDGDVVVATVSEALVNLIGDLIEDGIINYKRVVVYHEHGASWYDSDGLLNDWPYGLFNRCP